MEADLIGEAIELGARLRLRFAQLAERRKVGLQFLRAGAPRRRGQARDQRHASRDQRYA
jgi:hypothetical protein